MSDFNVDISREGDVVIIKTSGYLNNVGGEKISEVCNTEINNGCKKFLLDLEDSKVVNSIGVSILIEIIERLQDIGGKLGYYNLAPIVSKTFKIMGISSYSEIYETREQAIADISS